MRVPCAGAFFVTALIACSSSNGVNPVGGADSGADVVSEAGADAGGGEQAAQDMAKAFCERMQACSPFLSRLIFGGADACAAREALAFEAELGASGASDTPSSLEACAQAMGSVTCSDLFERKYPAACQPHAGRVAAGGACIGSGQCQSAYCGVPAGQVCGKCGARAQSGGSCTRDEDCDAGLACVQSKCAPFGASGASCSATAPCDLTLACIGGTCKTPLKSGDTCTPGASTYDCDFLGGLACAPASKTCVAIVFATANEQCGYVAGNFVACAGSAACINDSDGGVVGVCKAPAADGAACDASKGPLCVPPAACVGGTCVLPDSATCH